MLEYDRIDISEGIDINETNASVILSVIFFIIGTFLDKNFKCEPYLGNGFHNLMRKAMNFNVVAIISFKGEGYGFHF